MDTTSEDQSQAVRCVVANGSCVKSLHGIKASTGMEVGERGLMLDCLPTNFSFVCQLVEEQETQHPLENKQMVGIDSFSWQPVSVSL